MKRLYEYKYQEKVDTLQELKSEKEKLKMLYQWVKQGVINFSDFEALIFLLQLTVWLCAERGTSMAYSYCYMLFINLLKGIE